MYAGDRNVKSQPACINKVAFSGIVHALMELVLSKRFAVDPAGVLCTPSLWITAFSRRG